MNAAELRIGNNLVYTYSERIKPKLRGEYLKVIPDDILFLSENPDCDWIKPISINTEILLRCGFVSIGNNYVKQNLGIAYTNMPIPEELKEDFFYKDPNYWVVVYFDVDRTVIPIIGEKRKLKYLHELQNLWFSLFGEELEMIE